MNTSVSENDSETLRGSHVRSQEPGMQENLAIPQVDGLPSIPSRNRRVMPDNVRIGQNYQHDGTYLQGVSTSNRREYLGDSSDDNGSYRGQKYPNERGRLLDEERYPNRDGTPPRKGRSQDNGIPPDGHRGPPDGGGPSDGGGPPMIEGPLMETEDPQDALIEEDHQDLEDLLDQ